MPLVATIGRKGYVVGYQEDRDGRPILDSVVVISLADINESSRAKIVCQGEYTFLRGDLLTRGKYNPKKTSLNVEEANRLRKYLREQYKVKGLEGELQ